jgi:hypothetical protein
MRIKTKTKGQKIADTMTVEKFMNELSSSFVGKLFEGENGEPDTILLMQKYLDEGRGSSLEQILMSRAIAELVKLREEMANLTNPATCFKMGVMEEAHKSGRISGAEALAREIADRSFVKPRVVRDDGIYTIEDSTLSIENVMKICREDEQNQLAEMLHLQEEANKNNQEFNKSNMK